MSIDDLIRAKILTDALGKMSDEDKKLLISLSNKKEVTDSLERSEQQIRELSKRIGKYPFVSDLFANVAGNYLTDGITWAFRTLVKKLS